MSESMGSAAVQAANASAETLAEADDIIVVQGLKKRYRLGKIGASTLQGDLKRWVDRRRAKRDPEAALVANPMRAIEQNDSKHPWFYSLKGLDFTVKRGETLGIIGRNGAGKSTLLKILSRITAPTEGTVDLYGRVTSMLEVGTGFNGEMTGRENIYLNGAILGMTKAEIDAKIDDIVKFAEVERFIDTPVKRYSSGMYVKLGFSVAAHLDSEIMIMDEVLAVGDVTFQNKCLDMMRHAAHDDGRTVLYVSHNMSTVKRLCDRCLVIDEGRIVFDGDTDHAIALYVGGEQAVRTRFEYDASHRPYDKVRYAFSPLVVDSLEMVGKDSPMYVGDEPVVLEVVCTAKAPVSSVGFRLEFWSPDGVKIGSMLSGCFVDMEPGANRVILTLDTGHLTSGNYAFDLVMTQHGNDGERVLDGVYPAANLMLEKPLGSGGYVEWAHRTWGYVRLNDMDVQTLPQR